MLSYLRQYQALGWILMISVMLAGLNFSFGRWLVVHEFNSSLTAELVRLVMGYFLVCLGFLKVLDLPAFVEQFRSYDYFTKKIPWYGMVFPFLELLVALCAISGLWSTGAGILAIVMGSSGGLSIYTRLNAATPTQLSCGCAGAHLKLPLGTMSIVENVMMVIMGIMLMA